MPYNCDIWGVREPSYLSIKFHLKVIEGCSPTFSDWPVVRTSSTENLHAVMGACSGMCSLQCLILSPFYSASGSSSCWSQFRKRKACSGRDCWTRYSPCCYSWSKGRIGNASLVSSTSYSRFPSSCPAVPNCLMGGITQNFFPSSLNILSSWFSHHMKLMIRYTVQFAVTTVFQGHLWLGL